MPSLLQEPQPRRRVITAFADAIGVILILGGPRFATLETEIYRQTAQLLNLDLAAALTVVQLVAVVALLVVSGRLEGRQSVALHLRAARDTAADRRAPEP